MRSLTNYGQGHHWQWRVIIWDGGRQYKNIHIRILIEFPPQFRTRVGELGTMGQIKPMAFFPPYGFNTKNVFFKNDFKMLQYNKKENMQQKKYVLLCVPLQY